MTKNEKLIVSAFTGNLMTDPDDFNKYADKILGRPAFTYELAPFTDAQRLKESVRNDFIKLCEEDTEPKWISVKDRLPEKNGEYLCVWTSSDPYAPNGVRQHIAIFDFSLNLHKLDKYDFAGKKRPGWCDYDSEWGWCERDDVTHWMPLPDIPKIIADYAADGILG